MRGGFFFHGHGSCTHIEKFRRRLAEVEAALSEPKAFDNPQRAQELSREYARLKELVAQGERLSEDGRRPRRKPRSCSKTNQRNPNWRRWPGEEVPRLETQEETPGAANPVRAGAAGTDGFAQHHR